MAEETEAKVAKRGRGRPPKVESEKKAVKRAASAVGDAAPEAKKGRGRPKGSAKEKKVTKPKKVGNLNVIFHKIILVFFSKQATGRGRGRPKKVADSEEEESAEEVENGDAEEDNENEEGSE